jgi:diguanylate cyclase (GGDEF)-like protein/PAS domain S-box-containing protein
MEPTLAELTSLAADRTPEGAALLDQLPVAVLVCDLAGHIIARNATYCDLFGDHAPHRLTHLRDLLDERSRARLPEVIAEAFTAATTRSVPHSPDTDPPAGDEGNGPVAGEAEIVAACRKVDRGPLPCSLVLRVVAPTEVGSAALIVTIRPLNESAKHLERLRRSEHRLSTLLQHLPLGIIGSESGMRADFVNAAGTDVFAVGPEALVGMGWMQFVHPEDVDRVTDAIEGALGERRPAFVPVRIVPSAGQLRWVHLRVAPVGLGDDVGFVASIEDVTEQRQLGDELAYQNTHDRLTGLLNRTTVEQRLRTLIDDATAQGIRPAVLFVDVDDFKDINDSLGHLVGDGVLSVVAERLVRCVGPDAVVGRFGGDEFVVVVPHLPTADAALATASAAVDSIARPLQVEGHDIFLTASAGVTWLATDDLVIANASELLRRADLALYQAKRSGKNQAVLASDELLAAERRRLRLTRALRRAIHDDLLDVHYQPIVDLQSETIVGFEALVRWTDPELGRISPELFVPTAEANGLVGALGRNVLRRSLRELARWRRMSGHERLYVSVNMSMHELDELTVARQLASALGEADLPASALYVELTESALLRRESTAVDRLEAIRRLGIRLAIDDFGTGYSSLARLRRLPVDLVKIDKAFVRDLGVDEQASSVVGAIGNLASAMGLVTVAEGVETELQLAELRRVAGGYAQGFLFSEPVAADQVPDLLARRPLRRAA